MTSLTPEERAERELVRRRSVYAAIDTFKQHEAHVRSIPSFQFACPLCEVAEDAIRLALRKDEHDC